MGISQICRSHPQSSAAIEFTTHIPIAKHCFSLATDGPFKLSHGDASWTYQSDHYKNIVQPRGTCNSKASEQTQACYQKSHGDGNNVHNEYGPSPSHRVNIVGQWP